MLLKAPQPAMNGQMPLPASVSARAQRRLNRDNLLMARAKFAVLGFCQAPSSYSSLGINLVNDVALTQQSVGGASSTAAPGASPTGAGGYAVNDPISGPTVFDMGAMGLPAPPSYPPLTTSQGPGSPVIAVPLAALPPGKDCNPGIRPQILPPGGAAWGSASISREPDLSSMFSSIPPVAWLIGGIAILALATRGSR